MGSTPRASPRAPVRDAHSSRGRHLAASGSRTRPGGGGRITTPHGAERVPSRGTGGRSTTTEEPSSLDRRCTLPCESDVPTIERCVRPTSAHPRIRKRAPIVSCGDRAPVRSDVLRRLDEWDRCGRRFTTPCALRWLDDRIESGRCLPVCERTRSTSDAPVAEPCASRRDFRARASSSAEIDSRPHIVKRAGLLDPRRLPPTAGCPPCTGALASLWQDGSVVADATATTIRGRTHALS